MAKYHQRIIARELRKKGVSVNKIAARLQVSKSSVSLWVRDIILTVEQLEKLQKHTIVGADRGRLKSALIQKNRRLKRIQDEIEKGKKYFSNINHGEFFATGLAIYWAEGTKKQRRISFCNSDPKLIQLMISWLKLYFKIPLSRLGCYVGINQIHTQREVIVKKYWSEITGIPLNQFTKTSFKKVKNKKVYPNYNEHYGTLTVKIAKPADIYYRILGLIEGLYYNHNKLSQGSSVVAAAVS